MNLFRTVGQVLAAILFACAIALPCQAMPLDLAGQWYQVPHSIQDMAFDDGALKLDAFTPIAAPVITGGRFYFQGSFDVRQDGNYVIDFKNSSTIANFRHSIFNAQGKVIAEFEGGIMSLAKNPFFLRHGRMITLEPGQYRLVTELVSPYFIAPPQPYINLLDDYQQSIKITNTLTLVCLGIFIALGIYYATLAGVRMRIAEAMYALFIAGNFLFNSSALLVFSDVFAWHRFYLTSVPILFSNLAYIIFVMNLLGITLISSKRLFYAGAVSLVVMVFFIALAYFHPQWSLELARYGVGMFLCYGLTAGIIRGHRGNRSARLYVIAILCFFALGGITITSPGLVGAYTFYIEHLGLLSVATEVILLALVLSYQFAELHNQRESALIKLKHSEHIAYTDALTALPNRYALEKRIDELGQNGCLTFLDLDGLKYYNDQFGHERGDILLKQFGFILQKSLDRHAILHRLGGDEFAITCAGDQLPFVEKMLAHTVVELKRVGFDFAGFSHGSVYVHESSDKIDLMHMADTRMYTNKRLRKKAMHERTAEMAASL